MKIVSKKGCGLCITVKTMLQKKKIEYKEYAPDSDEGSILLNIVNSKELGKSVPVELPIIILDDETYYCGMNAYKYAKSLWKDIIWN